MAAIQAAQASKVSRDWTRRTGIRLAMVQAAVVIVAFAAAGYLTQVSVRIIDQRAIKDRVLGEVVSLHDEFVQKGADHLPYTVTKRSRLWRGFEYRLVGADGRLRAGRLPAPPVIDGWSQVRGPVAGRPDRVHAFLVHSGKLPDGSRLSVGQDLKAEESQMAAVSRTLILCGVIGVAFCLIASYLFTRGVWRRVAEVVAAAQKVSSGRLDVRAPIRAGGPKDDIDDLGAAFNVMLEEISLLISQVRQVSTDIAHDLRTPLTRVRQRLHKLQRAAVDTPDLLASVERIDADLEEILRTFDSMLRLAEIENQRGEERPPVDLGEIAAQVGEAYRPDIEAAGRRFDLALEPAEIDADPQLLAQAISNLLENALRHTPPGAAVAMSVSNRSDGAALNVTDRGEGIAEKDRGLVLQRFRRLDPSRSGPGSGLGLAIVAAIAKRNGAMLTLADAQPGLAVELVFPRRNSPA